MKKTAVLIFSLFLFSGLIAQDIPLAYTDHFNFKERERKSLYLNLYNFNYTRNYEYFNRFADGYTLFGAQLIPSLTYMADSNLAITGGIFLKNDFGNKGKIESLPYFNVRYRKNNWVLINGALEGTVNHRYNEILYHSERMITRPLEYGTQFILNTNNLFLDAWVDWMTMIYKPSPIQEEIMGGISAEWELLEKGNTKLSAPLQGIAYHKGGQIDTLDVPLTSIYNTSSGLKLDIKQDGFVKNIQLEGAFLYYRDFSFTKQQAFKSGSGFFARARTTMKHVGTLGIMYWKGDSFQSIAGAPIFQSVSSQINNPGYTEKQRELLLISLDSDFSISANFYIGLRLEPVIDLNHPAFEFSNSLYLIYRDNFLLKKAK